MSVTAAGSFSGTLVKASVSESVIRELSVFV